MLTTLTAEPQSAGRARRLVGDELRRCRCGALADVAELLTSELVTNALIHARSPVTLVVEARDGCARVIIGDGLPIGVPSDPRHAFEEATTGRGLELVAALAVRWGQELSEDGKVVWFELEEAG
jgi:anti-sigma regulatory factor (Ser/Thr protein kinase)